LQATSSPLLHHLAGIGMILGTVFEEPFDETAYQQVRAVLLALSQILENLDYGVHSTMSAQRLRDLVTQIDEYMGAQSAQSQMNGRQGSQNDSSIETPELHHAERSDTVQTAPLQPTNGIFGDWPFNLDFMQLTGGWPAADNFLIQDHSV
jgi:hypothetical protein